GVQTCALPIFSRSLWRRPEISSVLVALSGSRMLVAVATKLPPPAPRWWNDFVLFNPRTLLLRALAYDTWAMRERAQRYPAGEPEDEIGLREAVRRAVEPVLRPIRVIQADERARQVQQLSRAIAVSDPCDPAPRVELRNWVSTVDRLNRFIIEREGVARLLHIEQ